MKHQSGGKPLPNSSSSSSSDIVVGTTSSSSSETDAVQSREQKQDNLLTALSLLSSFSSSSSSSSSSFSSSSLLGGGAANPPWKKKTSSADASGERACSLVLVEWWSLQSVRGRGRERVSVCLSLSVISISSSEFFSWLSPKGVLTSSFRRREEEEKNSVFAFHKIRGGGCVWRRRDMWKLRFFFLIGVCHLLSLCVSACEEGREGLHVWAVWERQVGSLASPATPPPLHTHPQHKNLCVSVRGLTSQISQKDTPTFILSLSHSHTRVGGHQLLLPLPQPSHTTPHHTGLFV